MLIKKAVPSKLELTDKELDKCGFIYSSSRRKSILLALAEKPSTPSQLKGRTKVHMSHVSNILKDLVDEDIIICVNPHRMKGKIYRLTETGKKIVEYINLTGNIKR